MVAILEWCGHLASINVEGVRVQGSEDIKTRSCRTLDESSWWAHGHLVNATRQREQDMYLRAREWEHHSPSHSHLLCTLGVQVSWSGSALFVCCHLEHFTVPHTSAWNPMDSMEQFHRPNGESLTNWQELFQLDSIGFQDSSGIQWNPVRIFHLGIVAVKHQVSWKTTNSQQKSENYWDWARLHEDKQQNLSADDHSCQRWTIPLMKMTIQLHMAAQTPKTSEFSL